MIRARALALPLLLLAAACGQKGDLRLPAAQGERATVPAEVPPPPPASTPAPPSHK